MINEAIYTLHEGVSGVEEIDTVMKLGMSHPMGPLQLADFIGLDVCLSILNVLFEGFGTPKYAPCPLLIDMVQKGQTGVKSQHGFYQYQSSSKELMVAARMPFQAGVAAGVAVDAGIVDDGVHPAELVDLIGHGPDLLEAGEVADDHCRSPCGEVGQVSGPLVAAGVDDDLVAVIEQRGGGVAPEALGGAGDENAGHELAFSSGASC